MGHVQTHAPEVRRDSTRSSLSLNDCRMLDSAAASGGGRGQRAAGWSESPNAPDRAPTCVHTHAQALAPHPAPGSPRPARGAWMTCCASRQTRRGGGRRPPSSRWLARPCCQGSHQWPRPLPAPPGGACGTRGSRTRSQEGRHAALRAATSGAAARTGGRRRARLRADCRRRPAGSAPAQACHRSSTDPAAPAMAGGVPAGLFSKRGVAFTSCLP